MRTPIPVDFGFTDEHALLRQEARRFFAERVTMADVRKLADDPLGHDPGLWREMAELGWVGLVLPEAHGGAGLGHLHLALVLEEMGRRLVPSPLLATLWAGFALEAAGSEEQRRRFAPALAAGTLLGSLAICEPGGSWEPHDVAGTAEPSEGGFVLRGLKTHVLAGAAAGLVVAPFREPSGELALFAVELPAPGVSVAPEVSVDPTRRTARVAFDGARVAASARLPGDGFQALHATCVRAYAALAAEMVGGADSVLETTREYAVQRKQFDRSIGSFQGVKYPLVDLLIGVEMARSHAYGAAAALDADPAGAETWARMAKALASDVFATAVRKGVQLHGGYGFTWDCDLHFYFKRALWARGTLGDAAHHRRHLAADLIDGSGDPA